MQGVEHLRTLNKLGQHEAVVSAFEGNRVANSPESLAEYVKALSRLDRLDPSRFYAYTQVRNAEDVAIKHTLPNTHRALRVGPRERCRTRCLEMSSRRSRSDNHTPALLGPLFSTADVGPSSTGLEGWAAGGRAARLTRSARGTTNKRHATPAVYALAHFDETPT